MLANEAKEPLLRQPVVPIPTSTLPSGSSEKDDAFQSNGQNTSKKAQIPRRASGSAKKYQMQTSLRSNGSANSHLSETQSAPSSPLQFLKRICLCGRRDPSQMNMEQLQKAQERAKKVGQV
ncbi:unnamed protein product [Bursaphelenchus okinawaensis]|uniref:Uncharacterized protein n=1 Tax=Bursaphelenchus okinawaensis TaxID=465554 RepID=A0A811L0P5_9BILA|nr:unnamed protein product [Bursaphelenchus okinawaensis]CAG9115372.1 unnamed protein product [Bursaphelenchus okinawaensis]